MVLESLVTARQLERKPWEMLLYSVIVTSFSIWVAYGVFPGSASIVFLFLITMALAPVVYKVLGTEARIEEEYGDKINLSFFQHHEYILTIYIYLFLGVLITSAFWYSVLPTEPVDYLTPLFGQQQSVLQQLTGQNVGYATGMNFGFWTIFINNLKVSLLAFTVSFFFGTGAIFILGWNASVIAVFVGELARETATTMTGPLAGVLGFLYAVPMGLLSIALHGLPEVMAYCIAGMAGGILSAGIIRGQKDELIIEDAMALFMANFVILVIAAAIEVYITPAL